LNVPQTNEAASETTSDPQILRRQRRLFRRLTEEERAARFKRIIQLLQFFLEAWPVFSPLIVPQAKSCMYHLYDDLGDLLKPLPSEDTLEDLPEEDELV
jgi:hypothetical protein